MNVLTYRQPWRQVSPLFNDFHRRLASVSPDSGEEHQWVPRAEISKTAQSFTLALDIPGVDPDAVTINVEKNVLSVEGVRKTTNTDEKESEVLRSEQLLGKFHRRFTLSEELDLDSISAAYAHGVLTLSIDRKAEETPRRIEISKN